MPTALRRSISTTQARRCGSTSPLEDVDPAVLVASTLHTICPYKGKASYYSLQSGEETAVDAAWYYPDPCPLVAPIKGHVGFRGDRVRYDTPSR